MEPKLHITILEDSSPRERFPVSVNGRITIGRDTECSICIDDARISRKHATIHVNNGTVSITDEGSSNKTRLNGRELIPHKYYDLTDGAEVGLATGKYSLRFEISGAPRPAPAVSSHSLLHLLNEKKGRIIIGRDPSADFVLSSLQVSRRHAALERQGENDFILTDLESTNGTYVNGEKISGSRSVTLRDRITIGSYDLELGAEKMRDLKETGHAIIAERIIKKYGEKTALQELSIKIPAKSFVALMGPSGCGKSTLLKGLNGANPVTEGVVYIHGLPLDRNNFNLLKRYIGYVPQDDIVHRKLTVKQTMYYAAKLRMADDVTDEEIGRKVTEVLGDLNINEPKILNTLVGELSGGQRKRVSIAVELLTEPSVLFLDEPTSPLDPETIGEFLNCIKELTHKGVTVIMVTHKPADLEYVDRVIFLSGGGYLTFYDEKERLLPHFKAGNIIDVYAKLKKPKDGLRWNNIWREKYPHSEIKPRVAELDNRSTNFIRQLYWLSRRYLHIKWNDHFNMLLLLLQPVIIATLIVFIFDDLKIGVLFLMAISAIWFGVNNAAKEIVHEIPIYEREHMFNMSIFSYLFSKILILSLLALIQITVFVGIVYLGYKGEVVALWGYWKFMGFLFYLSVSAMLMGLLISAGFDNGEKVMTFVPLALIPQILLAGVIAEINSVPKDMLSYVTLGRWGTEGLGHLQDQLAREEGMVEESVPMGIMRPDIVQDSCQIIAPDSQACPEPRDTMTAEGAIEFLNYYGEDMENFGPVFNSFDGNLLVISIMNLIFFAGTYYLLKRRDKIN